MPSSNHLVSCLTTVTGSQSKPTSKNGLRNLLLSIGEHKQLEARVLLAMIRIMLVFRFDGTRMEGYRDEGW